MWRDAKPNQRVFLSTAALLSFCLSLSPSLSVSLSLFLSPSLCLSLSLSLHVSFYKFLKLPKWHFVFSSSSQSLSLAWFSFLVLSLFEMALIMSLNESFWQSSKKKRKENHSSWTCVQALLHRWRRPTPRQYNVVGHSFLLAVPSVARCPLKDCVSN